MLRAECYNVHASILRVRTGDAATSASIMKWDRNDEEYSSLGSAPAPIIHRCARGENAGGQDVIGRRRVGRRAGGCDEATGHAENRQASLA
jgi:hypothetical protein